MEILLFLIANFFHWNDFYYYSLYFDETAVNVHIARMSELHTRSNNEGETPGVLCSRESAQGHCCGILLTNSSHTSSLGPVSHGVLSYHRHLQTLLVSRTKAVALDGPESDPSSVLCYRVATFGGENTGDNVMGATFYCLPTLFAAIPRGTKCQREFQKQTAGLRQITV